MPWYTIAVFEEHPEAPDAAYRAVFFNDGYPVSRSQRVEADNADDALDRLAEILAEDGGSCNQGGEEAVNHDTYREQTGEDA
jgi:hypothetical protein